MKKGLFYAVGVGVGDPMDMTLRAREILEKADAVVIPVREKGESSVAYEIAKKAADMSRAKKIEIVFPMKAASDYKTYLTKEVITPVTERLDMGESVAMVTLGDVSVYSTASYLRQVLDSYGYETDVVAGIPSFIKAAQRAAISLCENNESFIVLPGIRSEESLRAYFREFDTIVIMKAGKAVEWLIPFLEENGLSDRTLMFCNVGLDNEYIGPVRRDEAGYFTTLIIKRGGLG